LAGPSWRFERQAFVFGRDDRLMSQYRSAAAERKGNKHDSCDFHFGQKHGSANSCCQGSDVGWKHSRRCGAARDRDSGTNRRVHELSWYTRLQNAA